MRDKEKMNGNKGVAEDEVNASKFTFRDLADLFSKYNQDAPVYFTDDENQN